MNALFSLTGTGIIKLEMESSMVTEAIQEEAVETYLRSRELKIWSLARS
jgi:hypothetical protein